MHRLWTIAWKDIYTTFSDRNQVLYMIVTPLAIATIVGLAFGSLNSGDVPMSNIPIAIVNQDEGSNGQNFGQILTNAFVPPEDQTFSEASQQPVCGNTEVTSDQTINPTTLYTLTDANVLISDEAARTGVDNGVYTAAIIIPSDFSRKMSVVPGALRETVSIEVYTNSGQPVPAAVIRSLIETLLNRMNTGQIAAVATLETIGKLYGPLQMVAVTTDADFADRLACAFTSAPNPLNIDQQTVSGQPANSSTALLVMFGSAQAMFFALFTGQQGVLSFFEEKRTGTLQRLVMSPTPRLSILLGKLVGTFFQCLFQLLALGLALTLVGSILNGHLLLIWGSDLPAVLLVMTMAAVAATGLGTFMAGITRTPELSSTFSQILNLLLALLGGAFGLQVSENLARFSLIYWGADAFRKLSTGQGDITLNLIVLLGHGVILFVIGWWLFNRRLDI